MVKVKGPLDPVEEVHTDTVGHSMTQQQFKQECDINYILSRYTEYGYCEHLMNGEPRYMDCSAITSKTFQEHLDFALDFEEYFDSLPQNLRDRFEDDPSMMMEYLSDDKNFDEAVKLGILTFEDRDDVSKLGSAIESDPMDQTPVLDSGNQKESE